MKLSKIKKTDTESFRAAMQAVRPLKPDDRHRDPAPRPASFKPQHCRNELPGVPSEIHDESSFKGLVADAAQQAQPLIRNGLPRKYLRQLGGRQCPVEDSFDLHGMNERTAAKALSRFLNESLQQDLMCVRVVHGKGLRSEGPPVLKLMSWQLLWQHPEVLALKPSAPADGGSGAVLVMLKSGRKSTS